MFEIAAGDDAFDVAVIGAGPAGAATARRLAQHGCGVLLVERTAFNTPRVGETLGPSVQPLLAELGVWDQFLALDPLPSWGTRSVWGGPEPQEHSHIISPYGCGWHMDRQRFDRMLANAAVSAGATLLTETRLVECERQRNGHWRLTLASSAHTSHAAARIVVDATGRNTRLGQRLGARRVVFDKLIGITVQFGQVKGDGQCYTLVETVPEGWWYSAPVGDDRMMMMLMTDSDICGRSNLTMTNGWFACLRAAHATTARVANAPTVWGPRVFNAISQRLHRDDTASGWLAVGDAALAVDPVSGSGVVRALRNATAGSVAALELLQGAPRDTIQRYEADCDRECTVYLQERAAYYGIERRWQESPFWRRRAVLPM